RIVCWSHVERKIEENIKGIAQDLKKKIVNDFRLIQSTASEQNFHQAFRFLSSKWNQLNNQNIQAFIDYFEQQWMSEHTIGWFEGYAEGFPSTNNGIESMNNTIKKYATLRDRLPLRDFVRVMDLMIEAWSKDRNPSFETTMKFKTIPEISTHEWTLGFNWCKSKKRIVKIRQEEEVVTCMVASEKSNVEAAKESCRIYINTSNWNSFDEFIKWSDSHKIVEINKECWQLSKCSCQYWKKNFGCKHVIGIAYNIELLTFPTLDLRIEKNASRSRRKKALAAFERNSIGPLNNELFFNTNNFKSV
ncbi:hypothetical protein BpHYR1_005336, partial [Brachionus plicatilis]